VLLWQQSVGGRDLAELLEHEVGQNRFGDSRGRLPLAGRERWVQVGEFRTEASLAHGLNLAVITSGCATSATIFIGPASNPMQ
jgi:hypothetical protein